MRFLSALLAPRAKPAPDRPVRARTGRAPAPARGATVDWENTRSYLDSVLTQIAAANEALAHRATPAFADTEPAAMEPPSATPPARARAHERLEGLDVQEMDDPEALMRLFGK